MVCFSHSDRCNLGGAFAVALAIQKKAKLVAADKEFVAFENQARDRLVKRALRRTRWRVLRIWEHELARRNRAQLAKRVLRVLGMTGDR